MLKHVTLLALLRSLTKKDKGLLLIDTHAGRGLYDLSSSESKQANEAVEGIERLLVHAAQDGARFAPFPEVSDYLKVVCEIRQRTSDRQAYPGSPLIALTALRPQDRLTLIESQPAEHAALREAVKNTSRYAQDHDGTPASITIECADGYGRLAAWLPPSNDVHLS